MTEQGNLIAVTEEVATAGAIVWWRLSGGVPADRFAEAWGARGLPDVTAPNAPTVRRALARAARAVAADLRGVLARPTRTGWALVREDDVMRGGGDDGELAEEDLEYGVVAMLRSAPDEDVRVEIRDAEAEDRWGLRMRLRLAYDDARGTLSGRDLSGWLCRRVVDAVGAVALRESGGVYFVPRDRVDAFERVAEVLGTVGAGEFFRVPAMRSRDAVAAIAEAMTREAEEAAREVEEEIAGGGLGQRALGTRQSRLEALRAKVGQYEAALSTSLSGVTDRLAHVEAALGEAAIAATVSEEAGA